MMGSLQEDFSGSYYPGGGSSRRHNGNNAADYRHRALPNTTGYQRSNNGANYVQAKLSSSASAPVANGRLESWQQQQPQQQPVRATRSAPSSIENRPANKAHYQTSSSSRRDYISSHQQGWPASSEQSRNLGRPITPADIERTDNRFQRLISDSPNISRVTKDRLISSAGRRYVSPVGSILKLAPRHDRVAAVESSSISSWNDDKGSLGLVNVPMAKGSAGRNASRSRTVDVDEPPVPPPRISRSRASSSSPTRLRRAPPGGANGLAKSTPSTTPRHPRRVLFKNNVAVYRFDSDSGADSSAYSSISESSELLNGEPRNHHGNRQLPQQRIGSGGIRQNGNGGIVGRQPPPVPGDPESDRPHVMPVWYGPTNGHQLVGSSLRQPVAGTTVTERSQSPVSIYSSNEQQQSTLWVDDPAAASCQMQALNRSTTVARIRYTQVQDGAISNQRILVITCHLRSGSYWDSDDIVVKANRAGSRVRIVFGGGGVVGPSDQLVLPVAVDPYRLVARLEPDSSLVIEAPVIHR